MAVHGADGMPTSVELRLMGIPWEDRSNFGRRIVLEKTDRKWFYYIGSAEDHEYPDLQVGDEVNPRPFFVLS